MTSRIGSEVQDGSQEFVNQRSRLWEKYDAAQQQERELNQYAGQFSGSNSSQNLSNLSNTNTPPDELAAAVWQLKQETEKIKQARSRIQSYQENIAKTKQQFFIFIGIAIAVFVIILIAILNR